MSCRTTVRERSLALDCQEFSLYGNVILGALRLTSIRMGRRTVTFELRSYHAYSHISFLRLFPPEIKIPTNTFKLPGVAALTRVSCARRAVSRLKNSEKQSDSRLSARAHCDVRRGDVISCRSLSVSRRRSVVRQSLCVWLFTPQDRPQTGCQCPIA